MIKESRRLIFIFPIWWADMPAIVKGFPDKVLLKQFAYVESKTGLSGRMGRGMAGAAQSGRMRRQKLLSAGTMDYVFSLLGIDGVGRTGPLKRPACRLCLSRAYLEIERKPMKTLIAEALRPFELTARYINADYQPAFAFHTIDSNAGYDEAAAGLVARSAEDYLAHLDTYYQ